MFDMFIVDELTGLSDRAQLLTISLGEKEQNGRLRVSQNGDFEPPADPQIEALVQHLELKNEYSTPSIEGRPRCPADFVK
ncbi:hypothetical protein TNCT_141631 [Trichonephila clavata]|uniref:Uncharacterized protein n=1 Tax=Trichonephila clavata TaxID=2740835 RepID=A0A8X6LTL3_TRICU|nr:hypothetical protein TNCT_141631 [Trichonephila clavata]